MADRSLVQNTADPRQVKNAARKEKQAREQEIADLAAVLSTEGGRRFLWRVLGYCKVFAEVFEHDSHRTAFNAGVRNVGLFLTAEIQTTDETAFFLMMRESRDRQQKQNDEADALRTTSREGENREEDTAP